MRIYLLAALLGGTLTTPANAISDEVTEHGRAGYELVLKEAVAIGITEPLNEEDVLPWCMSDIGCALLSVWTLKENEVPPTLLDRLCRRLQATYGQYFYCSIPEAE